MPIAPDTKDWTWVLERPCPECGFDVRTFPRSEISTMIRTNAAQWPPLLSRSEAGLRPSDSVWSALEYACHVRDVFKLYDHRLQRMLEEDDPAYENWDQDATAVAERYEDQEPATVSDELLAAAEGLASRFDSVTGSQWERTGTRSDGARFTIESFARYLIHDPIHHVHDVEKGFAALQDLGES